MLFVSNVILLFAFHIVLYKSKKSESKFKLLQPIAIFMVKEVQDKKLTETLDPKLPRGLNDVGPRELRIQCRMLEDIREVYERYGFEPLDTPALEFSDVLGKFLPDQDRPNEGVFSFQDEDQRWLSLRYDLTAPLARYVAENFEKLPKPFRRYATGSVFRNEKPGPGRFRQFIQFDADTVGAESVAADAEMCMLAADTLEALGIRRGDYVIKVNNRKLLDGILDTHGLSDPEQHARKLIVMRAIDKLDKFLPADVLLLLGAGRKDQSGDFTKGAGLNPEQAQELLSFFTYKKKTDSFLKEETWFSRIKKNDKIEKGFSELAEIEKLVRSSGYGPECIRIDPSVVRGLEYYTGPVFEAEVLFEVKNDQGEKVRFGSVGGGGRYDDLVSRFTGEKIPATGFSIGVSRLQAAIMSQPETAYEDELGPVIVLVMDKTELEIYQNMTRSLRSEGIRAEMYLGSGGMKAQMKYADKRRSPVVVIQGSEERARGEITLKDLIEGSKAAMAIKDNKDWKGLRPAQSIVPQEKLIEGVREILMLHHKTK